MIRLCLLWMTLLLCSGCSPREPIAAAQVLNHNDCAISDADMQVVTYQDVARLRGSRLLNMTTPQAEKGPDLLLLAISRGRQPTPGYRFELSGAFVEQGIATIELRWLEPDPGAVQPQVITHPCIVVGLERGIFQQVRAIDDQGNLLGEVSV